MKLPTIELAWNIKPLPKLFPNYGYSGTPWFGYSTIIHDGVKYHALGLGLFSICWYRD